MEFEMPVMRNEVGKVTRNLRMGWIAVVPVRPLVLYRNDSVYLQIWWETTQCHSPDKHLYIIGLSLRINAILDAYI